MSGNVSSLAVQRYIMHRTQDLEDVEEIIRELLTYAVIPEDVSARLCSVRDDVVQALADRETECAGKTLTAAKHPIAVPVDAGTAQERASIPGRMRAANAHHAE